MKAICTLETNLSNEKTASDIAKALELDNGGYIEIWIDGSTIHARAEADDIMSLRNTVDDYLACLMVAQKSLLSP